MKFGYIHKSDQAKLKFHTYLAAKPALPPPPKEVINSLALSQDIGMQGNDEIGLCTCADIAHGIVITTAMNKGIFVPQTADTIKLYEYTGYDPSQTDAQGNNPTDQGASLTEAANFAKKYGLAGHKLHGYLDLDTKNVVGMKKAVELFGQFAWGGRLPKSAMDSFGKGGVWSNIKDTNILGGHDMIVYDYDVDTVTFATWGGLQKATWEWLMFFGDETQARIYEDNIDNTAGYNKSAEGWNMAQFDADLTAL